MDMGSSGRDNGENKMRFLKIAKTIKKRKVCHDIYEVQNLVISKDKLSQKECIERLAKYLLKNRFIRKSQHPSGRTYYGMFVYRFKKEEK